MTPNALYSTAVTGGEVYGTQADGASAIAVKAGSTQSFSTSGAKLLSIFNNTNEKAFFDYMGQMTICKGDTGGSLNIKKVKETLTIAAAATTDSIIEIPANSIVLGVSCRVTTAIPTAATFDLGITGTTDRYGNDISVNLGTTYSALLNGFIYYAAATKLLITPDVQPANNNGRLYLEVFYLTLTAAAS
jgi:hypothetical protein